MSVKMVKPIMVRGPRLAPPPFYPFIVAQTLGTIRTDNSGNVGFAFTPNKSITVVSLGRWIISGNSLSHLVSIYHAGTSLASVTLNTALGVPGSYLYVAITPLVLTSGVQYVCVSQEGGGAEHWYNSDTTVTAGPDGAVNGSSFNLTLWVSGSISYVPTNFQYHL